MPLPILDLLEGARQANHENMRSKEMVDLFKHSHEQIKTALAEGGIGVDFPCPECGSQLRLVRTEDFYGRDYSRDGLGGTYRWVCTVCDTHVGCHGRTFVPLGTPAGYGLRVLRTRCHDMFDKLWKGGRFERNDAYKWLANKMRMAATDCHIGSFDNSQCKEALRILKEFLEVDHIEQEVVRS